MYEKRDLSLYRLLLGWLTEQLPEPSIKKMTWAKETWTISSTTKRRTKGDSLAEHFAKHGDEFGAKTAEQYLDMARSLLSKILYRDPDNLAHLLEVEGAFLNGLAGSGQQYLGTSNRIKLIYQLPHELPVYGRVTLILQQDTSSHWQFVSFFQTIDRTFYR